MGIVSALGKIIIKLPSLKAWAAGKLTTSGLLLTVSTKLAKGLFTGIVLEELVDEVSNHFFDYDFETTLEWLNGANIQLLDIIPGNVEASEEVVKYVNDRIADVSVFYATNEANKRLVIDLFLIRKTADMINRIDNTASIFRTADDKLKSTEPKCELLARFISDIILRDNAYFATDDEYNLVVKLPAPFGFVEHAVGIKFYERATND